MMCRAFPHPTVRASQMDNEFGYTDCECPSFTFPQWRSVVGRTRSAILTGCSRSSGMGFARSFASSTGSAGSYREGRPNVNTFLTSYSD